MATWAWGAAVGVVALVGGGLGYVRHTPATAPALASLATTSYYACPAAGATALGEFRDGDRVALVGRDGDAHWVEARAPLDLGQLVWLHAGAARVDVGYDVQSLPVRGCGDDGASSTVAASTTSTTAPPDSSSSSSSSEPASSSSGTTTTTGTTGTTVAPDQDGPVLGTPTGTPASIAEFYVDGDVTYSCGKSTTAVVRVTASDSSGVASVSLAYIVGTAHGTVATTLVKGFYTATIGPFPSGTITADSSAVQLTITATDGVGNTSTTSASPVTLTKCEFG